MVAFVILLLLLMRIALVCCDHFLFSLEIYANSDSFDFDVYLSDNIPLKVNLVCNQRYINTSECNLILSRVLQGYSKIAYFGTVFVSYFAPGAQGVNYTLSTLPTDIATYPLPSIRETRKVLLSMWDIVSNEIITAICPCYDNIANNNILLVVGLPNWVPLGIGSILKTFVSLKSIHANTKLMNLDGYVLGNYSSIIEDEQIVNIQDKRKYSSHMIEVNAYRLVILRDEEPLIPNDSILYNRNNSIFTSNFGLIDNKQVKFIQSTAANIDALLDCTVIPDTIVHRILRGVRQIKFKSNIMNIVDGIFESVIGRSLGVSIRSFQALHEVGNQTLHNHTVLHEVVQSNAQQYSLSKYQSMIRDIIQLHSIQTVILAYDNPELLIPQYISFISELRSLGVIVIEFERYLKPYQFHLLSHSLEKAAIELITLSRTNYLIGNKDSTFLDMVYWLGECKQVVFGI